MRSDQRADERGHRGAATGNRSPGDAERVLTRGTARVWHSAYVVAAVAFAPACVHAQQDTTAQGQLPPAGYGTLRQEDVALRLRTATLQIRVVPLDERVTRLLASDTYNSFHRLKQSRAAEIQTAADRYGIGTTVLFLVTFFGGQDQARFDPQNLTIMSQNRFFRPVEIFPLSPLWSGQLLNQRETATAIYLFEDGITILQPFSVTYENTSTNRWEQVLRRLDRERASVLARAAGERKP